MQPRPCAGVDAPEDIASLQAALRGELGDGADVAVYSDAVTALASGTGGVLHGCVLIAGTLEVGCSGIGGVGEGGWARVLDGGLRRWGES